MKDKSSQRTFIDTNILIYAEAADVPAKQQIALACLKRLYVDGLGVLSTQILQEYANVGLKKLKLPAAYVRGQVDFYAQFEMIAITPAILRSGIDLHQTRSVGFYDALVLASAQVAGCAVLLSEDFNTGEVVEGMRIVNPFRGDT